MNVLMQYRWFWGWFMHSNEMDYTVYFILLFLMIHAFEWNGLYILYSYFLWFWCLNEMDYIFYTPISYDSGIWMKWTIYFILLFLMILVFEWNWRYFTMLMLIVQVFWTFLIILMVEVSEWTGRLWWCL